MSRPVQPAEDETAPFSKPLAPLRAGHGKSILDEPDD